MGEAARREALRREAYAGLVAQVICFLLEMERSAPGTTYATHSIEDVVKSFAALAGITDLDEARRRLL